MEPESVLASTPGQSAILLVEPSGNLKLYDAQADTWVLSRKDFTCLSGAYAATDPVDSAMDAGTFVVGNNILESRALPDRHDGQLGRLHVWLRLLAADQPQGHRQTASGPGVIQNLRSAQVVLVVAEPPGARH